MESMTSHDPVPFAPGVRPPRLRDGDVVAVVAPSGPVPPDTLEAGVAVLEAWGVQVRVMPHVLDTHPSLGYLAGTDAARADDFTAAWADPEVRAVVCARGGYGAHRMVDLVDWDTLRDAAPKVLVGYSDVTVLHQAVASRLGVVTLHGPMPGTREFVDSTAMQDHLRATLFEPETVQRLGGPDAHAIVDGTATGVTTGGCVSLITTSVATPTLPAARGAIVLLEDIDEKAYRLDSYLTHLRRAGWFDGVAGIALGSWVGCEIAEPVVADILGDRGVPILGGVGFGHGPDAPTVPLGAVATIDTADGSLTFHEPALA
ncbi:S66 peptidase family protein [Desertimonas flava]|uniref:S66 peptidase family protein n=1 Tax=Desertimonas flava TaxID=2064846 RepID=UPI003B833B08